MSDVKKIAGKIVNHNSTFVGNVYFDKNIIKTENVNSNEYNNIIIPGFVDLHCHGGNGFDTMDGWNSIKKMSAYHLSNRTTSILPTTWTSTIEHTFNALKEFNNYKNTNTNILGVHL